MSPRPVPTYNLRAVLRETGLGADTLRAWERRYGVPKPERTAGGHRLYAQRDIRLIKWLIARQAEGLSISRAVQQWLAMAASAQDPLQDLGSSLASPIEAGLAAGMPLSALSTEWLQAGLAYDEATAEQVLNQAFALYPVETVAREVVQRGLREIGERWQRGQASVQQEHFLSALAGRRLQALIAAAPVPVHLETAVLACAPGEMHTLSLLHLTLLLRRRGWKVVFLGADVPREHLDETARDVKAVLIVLAAHQLVNAVSLRDSAVLLEQHGFPVGYGGRVFSTVPELRQRVPGEFLGDQIEAASDRIEERLAKPAAPRQTVAIGGADTESFRNARSSIELDLQEQLAASGLSRRDISVANQYFGAALGAALDLGDPAYLAADMDWIKALLAARDVPARGLREYLLAYAAVMRSRMGSAAEDAAAWLETYVARARLQ